MPVVMFLKTHLVASGIALVSSYACRHCASFSRSRGGVYMIYSCSRRSIPNCIVLGTSPPASFSLFVCRSFLSAVCGICLKPNNTFLLYFSQIKKDEVGGVGAMTDMEAQQQMQLMAMQHAFSAQMVRWAIAAGCETS